MSAITTTILNFLANFSSRVPITIFIIVGTIVEEIIAIIPSPFVPLTAGSLAYNQGRTIAFLLFLALVASLAKTLSASLVFWIADKLEDMITKGKIGKLLGMGEDDIERYGKVFSDNNKDGLILFILRALPFVPSVPVTVVAGLIKINFKTFFLGTFLGITVRNLFYLFAAYFGIQQFQGVLESFDTINSILEIVIIVSFLAFAFFILRNNWDKWLQAIKKKPKN